MRVYAIGNRAPGPRQSTAGGRFPFRSRRTPRMARARSTGRRIQRSARGPPGTAPRTPDASACRTHSADDTRYTSRGGGSPWRSRATFGARSAGAAASRQGLTTKCTLPPHRDPVADCRRAGDTASAAPAPIQATAPATPHRGLSPRTPLRLDRRFHDHPRRALQPQQPRGVGQQLAARFDGVQVAVHGGTPPGGDQPF